MIKTLGQTTNFTIQYQDTFSDALRRAQALQKTVEADFAKLLSWFGASAGFGPANRVTVTVDQASLAFNNGYHSDGTTHVQVDPFQGTANESLGDDTARALFIAEFSEVLMDYNNQTTKNVTWVAGYSNGEGLSVVCTGLFYPEAYYTLLGAPRVAGWLNSSTRNDWISQNESTDKDSDSFGCAALFIYYLYSQLNFSIHDIITKAGATLEATYQNLTGKSGAYAALTGLINPYFPPGNKFNLSTDDPFPLLQGGSRTVALTWTEEIQNTLYPDSTGTVETSPYFTCPVAKYAYTIYDIAALVRVTALVRGFGQPVYRWKINGQPASAAGSLSFTEVVYLDDPANPAVPISGNRSVQITYSDQGDTSPSGQVLDELDINGAGSGHIPLTIEVEVSERYLADGSISAAAFAVLDGQSLVYEDKYYKDRLRCEIAFRIRVEQLTRWKWINLLLTLPDPPPEIMRSVRILNEVADELAQLRRAEPALAREVTAGLTRQVGLSPRILESRE